MGCAFIICGTKWKQVQSTEEGCILMPENLHSRDSAESNLADAVKKEWEWYVFLGVSLTDEEVSAYAEQLSARLNVGKDSIKRRIDAIRYAFFTQKIPAGDIMARGQELTIGEYQKSRKKESLEKTVKLGYQVPGSLKAKLDEDMERVKGLLGIVTSEDYFDFIHSVIGSMSDDDIKQAAGGKDGA
jgi:hypothetical protein